MMRHSNNIAMIVICWFGILTTLTAEENSVWVEDATVGEQVKIILANEGELGGIQFSIVFPEEFSVGDITSLGRATQLDVYTSISEPGLLNVVMLDMGGSVIIPSKSPVLGIEFLLPDTSGVFPVELDNVSFSDTEGNTISGSTAGGYIIANANALRVGNGSGVINVNMYNNFQLR